MAKLSDNSAQGDLFADPPVGVEAQVAPINRRASDQQQPKTDPPDLTPQQLAALEGLTSKRRAWPLRACKSSQDYW